MTKPDLNIKKIVMTTHAYERAAERLKMHVKHEALNRVKNILGYATYIGMITGSDGEDSHVYVHNKLAIHISPDLTAVKTLIEYDSHGHYSTLKSKVQSIYEKEFRKVDRLEKARLKKLEHMKLKADMEIATLKYKKYKSRSNSVKEQCEQEMIKINNDIVKLEQEIKQVKSNKRELVRAMVTVVL